MENSYTRRRWLAQSAAGASAVLASPVISRAATAPAAPVAIAKCRTYNSSELLPVMEKLYDQIGGLGKLVKGKTVAIKLNLTGATTYRLGHAPLGDTHYTSPEVVAATIHLMGKAGARRIRLLESPWSTADPLEEVLLQAGWDPRIFTSAAPNVEFENTNYRGFAKTYARMMVPGGGLLFPGFELNHSYRDCDTFVSITKPKEHATCGITLSIKNLFGITPASIYGTGAGIDEPNEYPKGGRGFIHDGSRQPAKIAPAENDPTSPRQAGYRMPRVVVDLACARPIHLNIIEGVKSMAGGEGPWIRNCSLVSPGFIAVGTNPMSVDTVSMALMGFNPMAERGTPPFETCDSTMALAEGAGLGTRDLRRIEQIGVPIREAMFDFAKLREQRKLAMPQRKNAG